MHQIEPHYHWRDLYTATDDKRSPFYGVEYSEFEFSNKIYNYYIHPQWDGFGSPTLYCKILMADYEEAYAVVELLGEWNDAINNDIKFLKEEVVDVLMLGGIHKFLLIGENVLNFHGSDDSYYQDWQEELADKGGWICVINLREHIIEEMRQTGLNYWIRMGPEFDQLNWRTLKPPTLVQQVEKAKQKELYKI